MTVNIYTTDGSLLLGHALHDTVTAAVEAAVAKGTHLDKAHLAEAELRRARLPGAHLSGANLQGADMSKALLYRATLTNADLSNSTLSGADVAQAVLDGATLMRAYMSKVNLDGARLHDAWLVEAWLEDANLTGASLYNADLSRAYLVGARLEHVQLGNTNMHGAMIADNIRLVGRDAILQIGPVLQNQSLFAYNTDKGILYACADYFGPLDGLSREIARWFADEPDGTLHLAAFVKALECLRHRAQIWESTPAPSFSEEELATLRLFNQRLFDLGHWLRQQASAIEPALIESLKNPDDPLCDYDINAQIDYFMREDDPAWSSESDNILAIRNVCLREVSDEDFFNTNFNELASPEFQGEHHCWLFHDLYSHSYGPDRPANPLRECLRIDSVVVDIKVLRQYQLDIDSG